MQDAAAQSVSADGGSCRNQSRKAASVNTGVWPKNECLAADLTVSAPRADSGPPERRPAHPPTGRRFLQTMIAKKPVPDVIRFRIKALRQG